MVEADGRPENPMGRRPRPSPDPQMPGQRLGALLGPVSLVLAIGIQAVLLWPEIRLGREPIHDAILHQQLSSRIVEAVRAGENPLDCWVSTFSLGYSVWRTYQPLPHLVTAAVLAAASRWFAGHEVLAFLVWLLLCLYPPAFYLAARWFGLSPPGAGAVALLCLAVSAPGELARFGLGYGAFAYRGSGLYSQLWAIPLMVLALGLASRALRSGRGLTLTGSIVGITGLCHVIFGYAASVSVALLALLPAAGRTAGPRRHALRLVWIGAAAFASAAFLLLPALADAPFTNHSRWVPDWHWDSLGMAKIVSSLVRGEALDAGRLPILSLLTLGGIAGALLRRREGAARQLLGLGIVWLLLFFGRATWDSLTWILLVPSDLLMHRLQGVFEVSAVLLAGFGVDSLFRWPPVRDSRPAAAAAALGLAALLIPVMAERAAYLETGSEWGEWHRQQVIAEQSQIDDLLGQLQRRRSEAPGRSFAGLAARWGGEFKLGINPFFTYLARAGIDDASYLYHAMSLPSDAMVLLDDRRLGHLRQLGIRYLVAPPAQPVHERMKPIGRHGRFHLYELDSEDAGYFGLVAIAGRCDGDHEALFQCSRAWLEGAMPERGQMMVWTGLGSAPWPRRHPAFERLAAGWTGASEVPGRAMPLAGRLSAPYRKGEVYGVTVDAADPDGVFLVFRMTYHPGWRATVDGEPAVPITVAPGFSLIHVPEGRHQVRFVYRAGRLKTALFFAGLITVLLLGRAERRGAASRLEDLWTGNDG